MLFEFMPWQLDVGKESAKLFYESNDYCERAAYVLSLLKNIKGMRFSLSNKIT